MKNFQIDHITKYKRGSNQYRMVSKTRRFLGLHKRTWVAIVILLGIMVTAAYFGFIDKQHEPGQFISPIPANAYTFSTTPKPFRMPVLAPLPERERNTKLIRWIFGKDADQAIRVFSCESGLRSEAMNTHNSDGFPDVGIPQIHVTNGSPFSVDEMKNAVASLYQAKRMFDDRGWQPWDSSKGCWEK